RIRRSPRPARLPYTTLFRSLAFKPALEMGAVAMILAHNHPSGSIRPSSADKQITSKLKEGGYALDIKILDHLIIAQDRYYSFSEDRKSTRLNSSHVKISYAV